MNVLMKHFFLKLHCLFWITQPPNLVLVWWLQIVLAYATVFQTEVPGLISCISIWDVYPVHITRPTL